MKKYEIALVISEDFAEPKAKEIAKNVSDLIVSHGGKIDKDIFWGKRKMAYKINKNTFGYYFILVFDAEPTAISELNKELNLNEKIMRFLVTDFVEKTSFFEEFAREKEGGEKTRRGRERPQDERFSERKESKEEQKEEVIEEKVAEAENVEEEKAPAEEIEAVKEPEESIENAKDTKAEEAPKEEQPEEEVAPVEEDVAEEAKEDDRKPMTEEERKAKLDEKLAELLKEEE